jgi:hypothetical protein
MTRESGTGSPEPEPTNPLLRLLQAGRRAQRRHAAGELDKLPWPQPSWVKFAEPPGDPAKNLTHKREKHY